LVFLLGTNRALFLRHEQNLIFEMVVAIYVDCCVLQLEADMMTAVVARGKMLSINTSDLMYLLVLGVMNNGVDARGFNLVSRLKNVSN
jgi:hypothetical protein